MPTLRPDASAHVDPVDVSAFVPLRPAEQLLLRAFAADEIARVGLRRPLVPSADITVRGGLIAHLARGGGAGEGPPHRVQVVGAWIEGQVNLRDASIAESLWFFRCVFDAVARFDGARIAGSLSFPGCLLPGLRAEDCTIAGDLALNAGCTVRLDVRLARTTVGRNLNFGRAQLRGGERIDMQVPRRLIADDARIAGDALLTDGFEADGDVRLVGLRVVGDLRASAARLSGHVNGDGQRGDALNLDLAHVAGNVVLDQGFSAAGAVRMRRAQIDGDLDCTQAAFDAFNDMGWRGAVAFAIDRARIGGSLVLARLKQPLSRATLAGASVGTLHDDNTSWGESLVLDGFAYRQLAAPAPASSSFRIEWLSRQEPAHMGRDFRAQPWHQLIRVLQRMGLPAAARDVAVAREVQLRRVGRVGANAPLRLRWLPRLAHRAFGLFAGYGHRPWRPMAAMVLVWLACAMVFSIAAARGAIVPSASWQANERTSAPQYPSFNPLVYSLEHLLPFIEPQQRRLWSAAGDRAVRDGWGTAARVVSWHEALLGWAGWLLLALCLISALNRRRGEL
jgi:hypothetical protein